MTTSSSATDYVITVPLSAILICHKSANMGSSCSSSDDTRGDSATISDDFSATIEKTFGNGNDSGFPQNISTEVANSTPVPEFRSWIRQRNERGRLIPVCILDITLKFVNE